MHEMSDDLRIGVGGEFVALGPQLATDGVVVLDDAVVHNRDPAAHMGMGVAFGGHAVGGPAGVADADGSFQAAVQGKAGELGDPAGAAQAPQAAVDDRHAGRVITPVFQAPQAFDQDGDDVSVRYRSDDSAHTGFPCRKKSVPAVNAAAAAATAGFRAHAPRSVTPAGTASGRRPRVAIQRSRVSDAYARRLKTVTKGPDSALSQRIWALTAAAASKGIRGRSPNSESCAAVELGLRPRIPL